MKRLLHVPRVSAGAGTNVQCARRCRGFHAGSLVSTAAGMHALLRAYSAHAFRYSSGVLFLAPQPNDKTQFPGACTRLGMSDSVLDGGAAETCTLQSAVNRLARHSELTGVT